MFSPWPRPSSTRRTFRPRVEPLEEILAPANFTVSTLTDTPSHLGVSLRDALDLANADPDSDTISFESSLNGGTITLLQGELTVAGVVTVRGPGANLLTIDANNASRVFTVDDGTAPDLAVTIQGLTLTNGNATVGGGVHNSEDLTLDGVAITECDATDGGGVYNNHTSTLTVLRSLIADNNATGSGGGVYSGAGSALTVSYCTITGNEAGDGGGVVGINTTEVVLNGSTIAANTATTSGGGTLFDGVGFVELTDNLIAGNSAASGDDLSVNDVSDFAADYNLIQSADGHPVQDGVDGNIVGEDPKLGTLTDNGGTTKTMQLLAGSPALNSGSDDNSLDQRGFALEGKRDIGAFEAHTPTDISLSNNTIPENAGANAVVGNLSVADLDGETGAVFTLVANAVDNSHFNIANGQLRANASFDFDVATTYTVRVLVTDLAGLTIQKDFTITVTRANTPPTLKSPHPSTRYVAKKNKKLKVPEASGVLKEFFTDADGDSLTAELVTAPPVSKGTLTLNPDGSFKFRPKANVKKVKFVVRATDGVDDSPTLQFTIIFR